MPHATVLDCTCETQVLLIIDLFAVCVLAMGELVSHKPLADKGSADKKQTKITLLKSIAFLVVSI